MGLFIQLGHLLILGRLVQARESGVFCSVARELPIVMRHSVAVLAGKLEVTHSCDFTGNTDALDPIRLVQTGIAPLLTR